MALIPPTTGIPIDLTTLISALQTLNQILTRSGQTLAGGIAVLSAPPIYTVAGLPAAAANGAFAFASNGRKPSEGSGSGTGVPVFFNPGTMTWFSYCSGAAVAS